MEEEACSELEDLFHNVSRHDLARLAWSTSNSEDSHRRQAEAEQYVAAAPPPAAASSSQPARGSGRGRGRGRARYMRLRPPSDDAHSLTSQLSKSSSNTSDDE